MPEDAAVNHPGRQPLPAAAWYQAGMWMGCDFFGLLRLLGRHRFAVHPGRLPACLFDLWFSAFNTATGALQQLLLGPGADRTKLEGDPIFIIGHWRTGTTLLHELLAMDGRLRCPTTFECFTPNNFLISETLLKPWSGFTLPRRRPPDNMQMGWDLPQEDEFALCNMGVPCPYWGIAFPNQPRQADDYFELDRLDAFQRRRWQQALRTFLARLTYKRPGRIVLKSPPHTFRLPILREMFPDARFIHLVRNPYVVFPSTVRLWKSLYVLNSYQEPTCADLEEQVLATFSRMHQRLEATRGLIGPARFCEVRYEDLLAGPLAAMRQIYEQLELGGFERVAPAIGQYFRDHADYQTNRFELTPDQRDRVTRRWGPYIEKYGYGGKDEG
ncbi:MAG: sulfotransferase family protein [Thermoguttaceae bacterium]